MQVNDKRPWCLETDAGGVFFGGAYDVTRKQKNVKNYLDSNLK